MDEKYPMTINYAIMHHFNHGSINFEYEDLENEEEFAVLDQNLIKVKSKFNEIKNRILFIIGLCGLD